MENAQLARLVEEHGDTLLRMCFLYLRDVHLAQDAVQDAFVRAATTPAVFESRSSEKTWLCRIAINVCKNYRRSAWFRKTQPLDLPEELPAPEPRAGGRYAGAGDCRPAGKIPGGGAALLLPGAQDPRDRGHSGNCGIHRLRPSPAGAGAPEKQIERLVLR